MTLLRAVSSVVEGAATFTEPAGWEDGTHLPSSTKNHQASYELGGSDWGGAWPLAHPVYRPAEH